MFSEFILDKLYENEEFCTKLGKVVLLSSKLEKQLFILLQNEKLEEQTQKPSFGMLIKYIDKKDFFPAIVPALNQMTENNIEILLNSVIKQSIIDESSADDEKPDIYIVKITTLENRLNLIFNMIQEHNKLSL
jgi:hypothetical protein